MPLVSIVVPCHLRTPAQAALLDETLATVDGQTLDDYEVVVVDDGSPIAAAPIAARHRATRTVTRPNAGCAAARNTGIQAISGDLVVFLDADDHLLAPALETGARMLTDHPDAGWTVGPREEMTYEGGPVPWTVDPPPPQTALYRPLLAFEWFIIPPSAAMFRRTLVDALGGFRDPWGADDLDFYLRAAWASPAVCYQAPAVTRYRRYSTSSSRDGERMLRSVRAVYDRQRPLVTGRPELEAAWQRGLSGLTSVFVDCLGENVRDRVKARQWRGALRSAWRLACERAAR